MMIKSFIIVHLLSDVRNFFSTKLKPRFLITRNQGWTDGKPKLYFEIFLKIFVKGLPLKTIIISYLMDGFQLKDSK